MSKQKSDLDTNPLELDPQHPRGMSQVIGDCLDEPRFLALVKAFEKPGAADRYLGNLGWSNDARRRMRSAVSFKGTSGWTSFLEGVRRPAEATLVFDESELPAIPGLRLAHSTILADEEASCARLPFFCRDLAFTSYPDGLENDGVLVTTLDAGGGCDHDLLDEHGVSLFRHERVEPNIARVWPVKDLNDRNLYEYWGGDLPGYKLERPAFNLKVQYNCHTVDARFTLDKEITVVSKHVACCDEDGIPMFYRIVGIHQVYSEPTDSRPHGMSDHIYIALREDVNPNHQHPTIACTVGQLLFVRKVIVDAPVGLELKLAYNINCKLDIYLNDFNSEPIVHCNDTHDAVRSLRRRKGDVQPLFDAKALGEAYQALVKQYESLVCRETSIALSDLAGWKLATQPPDNLLSLLTNAQRYARI